ncbi:MAG: LPS assembly lipoprotein LptE [Lentisphaeria bacterium]
MKNNNLLKSARRFQVSGIWLVAWAVFALAMGTGCARYEMGFINHPQMQTVGIGSFENHTDEPAMEALLRKKLAEMFSTRSALRLADPEKADIVVRGNIKSYSTRQAATAKVRDENEQPDNRSSYRTTIYRLRVRVDFETVIPEQNHRPAIPQRSVIGEGNFSEMPDLHTARRIGLQQALRDAAEKIVVSVTEAW